MVSMERSEGGWINVDSKVKCEQTYKENVNSKTRRRRKCVRKERQKKKKGQESIKDRKSQKMRAKKQ